MAKKRAPWMPSLEDEKARAKDIKANTRYGVFLWNGHNIYPAQDAVAVYKLESAAVKHADKRNLEEQRSGVQEDGYVVRSFTIVYGDFEHLSRGESFQRFVRGSEEWLRAGGDPFDASAVSHHAKRESP